ncbi:unnamed protein product [Timema podura]|uniref:Uncharacterized protein n=1 Tax=Timema podura TaxID=61482 RepID=A0ABN7P7I5_TIMPD|nr:unnamed protein product [Timema podura]
MWEDVLNKKKPFRQLPEIIQGTCDMNKEDNVCSSMYLTLYVEKQNLTPGEQSRSGMHVQQVAYELGEQDCTPRHLEMRIHFVRVQFVLLVRSKMLK